MKIKISDYNNSKELFAKFITSKPEKLRLLSAAEYSACSGIPIIVIYKFMIDLGLNNYNLEDRIKELTILYEVDLIC